MTLWDQIDRLRKELDGILEAHRYSEMSPRQAVRACLSDRGWWTVRRVHEALREGGCRDFPVSTQIIRKYISENPVEWQYTGAQGGEKKYRLRQNARPQQSQTRG